MNCVLKTTLVILLVLHRVQGRVILQDGVDVQASARNSTQVNGLNAEDDPSDPANWPAKNPFTIRIAVGLYNTENATSATREIESGYEFWQYVLNKKGGIPLGENKNALVEVKFLRYVKNSCDNANKQRHRDVLTKAITQGDVDFILGGDTLFAQEELFVSQQQRRLTLLCCHGPPLVYRQAAEAAAENGENMLFGIHVNSELYTNRLIRSIVVNEKADKIALVVSNRNTSIFTATAAASASLQLKLLNYTGIYANFPIHEVIEIPQESTEDIEFYKNVARRIRDENFDTVFGFTLEPGGSFLLKSLQEEKTQLKTVFVTVTPTNNASVSELVKSGVQMEHILSAGQWHVQLNFGETESYNPADAAAAQPNLRGDAVSLDSVVSKKNIQDRVLWPTSTYFAEMFERYKNSTEPVTYTQASAAAAAYALQLGITEAFKSCQGIESWNGSTESLLFTTKWICGSQSTYSLGGTQQTGYQLVLRALRALNRDTFFGKIFFSQDQRNVGRDAVTYQLLNQTESRFKFLNDVSFGLDSLPNTTNATTVNKVKLVQEVVLPSEYETKRLVLPRPPRITDVDWCEGGTGLDENADCRVCSAGEHRASFSGEAGVDLFKFTCFKCNLTSYQENSGATECNSCPENSETGKLGATSLYDCRCKAGYYNETFSPGVNCTSCPEGAECPGGLAPLILEGGYWSENATAGRAFLSDSGEFKVMPCTPPSSCANSERNECAVGWGGNLCSQCGYNNANDTQDYFLVFGSCKKCTYAAVNLLIFLVVMVLWLAINLFMAEQLQSFALLIDWFQLFSLVGAINVAWPRSLQKFFSVAAFFAFEVDVVSLRCLNPDWNFLSDMILQFCLPLMVIALYTFLGLSVKLYRRLRNKELNEGEKVKTEPVQWSEKEPPIESKDTIKMRGSSTTKSLNISRKFSRKLLRAASKTARALERRNVDFSFDGIWCRALNILEITYLASVQYGFSALRGIDIGNETVVAKAPYLPQSTIIVVVGAVGLAVLGVAFTVYILCQLWVLSPDCPFRKLPKGCPSKEKDHGGFIDHQKWLGWLYKDFRMEVYYMSAMHLVHRFLFAAVVSLVVRYEMQLLVSVLLTVFFGVFFYSKAPYYNSRLNILQAVLYASLFFQLGFALTFAPYTDWAEPSWQMAFLYCNWAMIILVFGIIIWVIAMDYLEWRAHKNSKRAIKNYIEKRPWEGSDAPSYADAKLLIDVFSPTRLWSWIKSETDKPNKKGAPKGLEDFLKVAKDLADYKKPRKHDDYSWLSMNDEAELWRSLVNKYPGIVAYIFNGSDDEVEYLYNFYVTFYNKYWNMQESWLGNWYNNLYKVDLKAYFKSLFLKLTSLAYWKSLFLKVTSLVYWKSLVLKVVNFIKETSSAVWKSLFLKLTVSKKGGEAIPERNTTGSQRKTKKGFIFLARSASITIQDRKAKSTSEQKKDTSIPTVSLPTKNLQRLDSSKDAEQRVEHISWLLQSRDKPFIARWLACTERCHPSRKHFKSIIKALSLDDFVPCTQEKAMKILSLNMLALFHKQAESQRSSVNERTRSVDSTELGDGGAEKVVSPGMPRNYPPSPFQSEEQTV